MEDRPGTGAWDDALRNPDDLLGGSPGPSFASRLDRWVADARADDAAARRARERWLRSVAEQEATFAGVLADLAERQVGVVVTTTAGRRHLGLVEAIGADFVALRVAGGRAALVALGAVSSLRTAPSVDAMLGDRAVTTELALAEVLAELGAERERVVVQPRSGEETVAGELRSVGQDVVVVRTDAEPPATAYLPLASVGEVLVGWPDPSALG